jgi:nucleotide-binding universal stress UspA family protein
MRDDRAHDGTMSDAKAKLSGRIVVGVDGSVSSLAAIRWAYRQAELTGASLTVVGAWGFPVYVAEPNVWPGDIDLQSVVQHQLKTVIDRVLPARATVPVTVVTRQSSPALALLKESEGADLLVVGTRGHGEFAEMLLGSVSLRCVAHARCPVVVVHEDPAAA